MMFGKKRRNRDEARIVALDGNGAVLLDSPAGEFQLPEACVIALSVEYFSDPEPCEIHRAAVRWRAIQQLQESCPPNADVPVTSLDATLRGMFPESARAVRVVKEEA